MAIRDMRSGEAGGLAVLALAVLGLPAVRPAPAGAADPPSLAGARVTVQLQSGKTVEGVSIVKVRPGRIPGTVASVTITGEGGRGGRVLGAAAVKEILAADGSCLLRYDEIARTLVRPGAENLEAIRKAAQETAPKPAHHKPSKGEPSQGKPDERKPPDEPADRPAPKDDRQLPRTEAQRLDFFNKTGVWLWPELTGQEQQAAVARHKEFLERVGKAVGGAMRLYEAKYFLVYSDFPSRQATALAAYLDKVYGEQCKAFGIGQGTNIWLGKAVVVAYQQQQSFARFEREFYNSEAGTAQGRTHQRKDGTVVIACHQHGEPGVLAMVLAHETTHGFMHRYKSRQHLPAWIEEGAADFMAARLVPSCKIVQQDQQRALTQMRQTRSLGGDFFTARKIATWQYGVASSLTEFMLRTDPKGYRKLIEAVKMGQTWQEGLKAAYGVTPEELVEKYGRQIGIPNLKP